MSASSRADAGAASDRRSADAASGGAEAEVRSWGWHIMAVSSWLLLVLLPVHLLSTWVLHDPAHFGVALYVDRWHHTYWRFFDGALVVLALTHGAIGLHSLLVAGTRQPSARAAITAVVAVVAVVVGLLAVSTIFTFNLS